MSVPPTDNGPAICPECGQRLIDAPSTCPNCGATIAANTWPPRIKSVDDQPAPIRPSTSIPWLDRYLDRAGIGQIYLAYFVLGIVTAVVPLAGCLAYGLLGMVFYRMLRKRRPDLTRGASALVTIAIAQLFGLVLTCSGSWVWAWLRPGAFVH